MSHLRPSDLNSNSLLVYLKLRFMSSLKPTLEDEDVYSPGETPKMAATVAWGKKSTKFVLWINVVDASLHRKLESFQNIIKHITLSKFRPRYLVRFYYPIMVTTKKFCEQEKKPAKFLSKLWSFYPKFKLWSITLRETEKHCTECLMAEGCKVLIYFSKLQFKKCNFKSTLIRRLPGDTRIESRPVNKYVTFLNF